MAEANTTPAAEPGNPLADILDLIEAGLRVVPRGDLRAVELHARAAGMPDTRIVLAVGQALTLADRLNDAALEALCAWAEAGR